jgi:hypothetical protein
MALTATLFACNALVGWDELQRVRESDDSGEPEEDSGKPPKKKDAEEPAPPDTGPLCDPTQPFGAPELATEFDPTMKVSRGAVLSPDALEAYFVSGTSGSDFVMRRTTRPSRRGRWTAATTVNVTPPPLAGLSMSAGGLKLFYESCSSSGVFKCENLVLTRKTPSDPFVGAAQVFVRNGEAKIDLFVVESDDVAYFSRIPPDAASGNGFPAIMVAPINATGVIFTTMKVVANLHLPDAFDDRGILNEAQTVIYFSSSRPGANGGGQDIWMARRKAKSDNFGTPVPVPELSAPGTDYLSWVSSDDCEIFMTRADHVYYARRPLL